MQNLQFMKVEQLVEANVEPKLFQSPYLLLQVQVALKLGELLLVRCFFREAAVSLSAKNIVELFDVFFVGLQFYIVSLRKLGS